MSEDKVVSFDWLMAREAGFVHRLIGGFAVVELRKPPTTRVGVFF
jgi:hypothetical protein